MTAKILITHARLREALDYDPATGVFHRLTNGRGFLAGQVAGGESHGGYIKICIDRHSFYAHRLAWFYTYAKWPAEILDHRDGNPSNNRIDNLREASQSQNVSNGRRRLTNRSGVKGVCFDKRRGKWIASITSGYKQINLGRFNNIEAATRAYRKAATKLHGEFANLG
jgi:hypothetical protein